jgi:hypothetical protein
LAVVLLSLPEQQPVWSVLGLPPQQLADVLSSIAQDLPSFPAEQHAASLPEPQEAVSFASFAEAAWGMHECPSLWSAEAILAQQSPHGPAAAIVFPESGV